MEIKADYLHQRYSAMKTEDLIELQRNGGLTEVATGILDEILKTRGVSDEIRLGLTKQIEETMPKSPEKSVSHGAGGWLVSCLRMCFVVMVSGAILIYIQHPQKTNRIYLKEAIENGVFEKVAVTIVDAMKKTKTGSNVKEAEWEQIEKGISECMAKEANSFLLSGDPYLDAKADMESPTKLAVRFVKACVHTQPPQGTNRTYLKELIENGVIGNLGTTLGDNKRALECVAKEANSFLLSGDPYLDEQANKETGLILGERFLKACGYRK